MARRTRLMAAETGAAVGAGPAVVVVVVAAAVMGRKLAVQSSQTCLKAVAAVAVARLVAAVELAGVEILVVKIKVVLRFGKCPNLT